MKEELWAWHDFQKDTYSMIYPRKFIVEMCSPDGFKQRTKRGEGKIVKLKVIEVVED